MCIIFNIIHIYVLTKFRCDVWIEKCGPINLPSIEPIDLYKNYRICSLHFDDTMYINAEKSRLSDHTIPTLLKGMQR